MTKTKLKNMYLKRKHRLLALLLLLTAGQLLHGGNLKFVVVIYDVVTYAPVAGKSVGFELTNLSLNQQVVQQTYTTGPAGDFNTPHFSLPGSTWFKYSFQIADCQNQPVVVADSLFLTGNDTLFLYIGVCHSIMPGKCIANFYSIPDTSNPLIIHFHDISAGHPTSYQWSFGDGTTSQMQHPVKHYTAPGSYLVCLTVADTSSFYPCQNTSCQVVNITQGVIIQAGFVAVIDSFALQPRRVRFENNSYSNVYLNHTLWNFGDGNTSQSLSPVNHYLQSGSYQVCLVTGNAGVMSDTSCSVVIVPDYYDVWGQIFAGGTTADKGFVQLIHPVGGTGGYRVVHETPVDTLGLYFFVQRIQNNYLIRAFPDPLQPSAKLHIPTYSGNTIYWKKAAPVNLNTDIQNLDIALHAITPPGTGPAEISGQVFYTYLHNAPKALVLLLHADTRQPAAYAITDSLGQYTLNHLPYGNYILLAEVPGLETSELYITLSPQNQVITGQDIYLDIPFGLQTQKTEHEIAIFPNPASTITTIKTAGSKGPKTLTLTNSLGHIVHHETIDSDGPETIHPLNISHLPAGMYMVSITTQNYTTHRRLIIQR